MLKREDLEGYSRLIMEYGKANVLDTEFLQALSAALEEIERDEVPALVLTGRGRIFSAGVALDRVVAGGADYLKDFLPALDDCLERIFSFRHPLVAAINGHAIAGGAILACAADHRLLARGAGMGVPELRVGVPFPAAAIEILRFALTPGHLVEVLQGGATYRDDEALLRGFADELVDADAMEARATEVALDLASIPATSFELTKAGLRSAASRAMAEEEVRTGADIRRAWSSEPVLAAIAAYVERVLGK